MGSDDVCLAHSGLIKGVEVNGQKLDRVIALLEAQGAAINNNDRRISRIYTVISVMAFIGSTAFACLTMAVRLGWLG